MATLSLKADNRIATRHSARTQRADSRIPAVVYGPGIKDSLSVSVGHSDFVRLYRQTGSSALIKLQIPDNEDIQVLVHDMQMNPVYNQVDHVDFLAIDAKQKTSVKVPLIFTGVAPAVKDLGGVLIHNYEAIDIRCLPVDIPANITVDTSSMANLHDQIVVRDLNLDTEKLEIMNVESDTALCVVTGQQQEIEEEETTTEEGEEDSDTEETSDTEQPTE